MILLALIACQEPFGTDRHRLEGFRIVAVDAAVDDEGIHPSAVVVHEGRVWTEDGLRFSWYVVPDTAAAATLTPIDPPDAEGPSPVFPTETSLLALLVTNPEGQVRRAVFAPGTTAEAISELQISAMPLLNTNSITAEDLALAARRELVSTDSTEATSGDFIRIALDATPTASVRWMATAGTFFELETHTTDWAPARIVVDDANVEVSPLVEDRIIPFVAVAVSSETDANVTPAVRLFDLTVGEVGQGFWNDRHRWIPTDSTVPAGTDWLIATLAADDTSPFGLRLNGPVAADPPSPEAPPNTALPCAVAVSGPFDPDWLARGLCTRDSLVGSEAMIRVQP